MRIQRVKSNCTGLTVLEILVVLFTLTVLVALILPNYLAMPNNTRRTNCLSNQRQVGLGLIMCAIDNDGKYPWEFCETNTGYFNGCANGYVAADFNAVADHYIKYLPVFVCPTDPVKVALTNITLLKNQNTSYFAGYERNTNLMSASVLTGDRHLQADGHLVKPGLFIYTTNIVIGWTSELHRSSAPRGVMSFYDGHAELVPGTKINAAFMREGLAQARFAVP